MRIIWAQRGVEQPNWNQRGTDMLCEPPEYLHTACLRVPRAKQIGVTLKFLTRVLNENNRRYYYRSLQREEERSAAHRPGAKQVDILVLTAFLAGGNYGAHFPKNETKMKNGLVTCLRSHSWYMEGPGCTCILPDSQIHLLSTMLTQCRPPPISMFWRLTQPSSFRGEGQQRFLFLEVRCEKFCFQPTPPHDLFCSSKPHVNLLGFLKGERKRKCSTDLTSNEE